METLTWKAVSSMEKLLVFIWILAPVLFGLWARTNMARVLMPGLVGKFYKYAICHAVFFTLVALNNDTTYGMVFVLLIAAPCYYFWLFHYFSPHRPDHVPLGVRLLANFGPGVARKDQDGLFNTDHLKRCWPNPGNAAKAKADAFRAKMDAYKMAAAKEHADAEAELARATREYNEAKLRAEEAKRRSSKVGW